jgi:hypothetical protein
MEWTAGKYNMTSLAIEELGSWKLRPLHEDLKYVYCTLHTWKNRAKYDTRRNQNKLSVLYKYILCTDWNKFRFPNSWGRYRGACYNKLQNISSFGLLISWKWNSRVPINVGKHLSIDQMSYRRRIKCCSTSSGNLKTRKGSVTCCWSF